MMRIKIPIFKHNTEMVTDGGHLSSFSAGRSAQIQILNSIFSGLILNSRFSLVVQRFGREK